ncbi:MAG: c-type cytochrome [Alphaproteobacteria bacterium]|nr:c-type cytochrome [Alphaproteobacteria bacterium]
MLRQHLTATFAAGLLIVGGLIPALAVPRWVPLPVAKSAAMNATTATGDATRGAALFAKCQACHETGETAGHRVGPALTGIVNRPAATYQDFAYSGELAQAGKDGLIWTRDFLNEYLEAPSKFMPEGIMAFVGVKEAADRADLIAYLATFKAPKSAPWLFRNQSRADIPLPGRSPVAR